ncbi:hypothetical protein [Niallia sp. RD1]|uniref:hypothetical protein n=1 Tax=Niallia sp. RD1 TaxID=2962858 RepID=UPI0020C19678|nr:hypothetical protein [Niallia sp. RD1]UTI40057.1 hypothetical protein NKG37_13965 [Niallia sp. RD1]
MLNQLLAEATKKDVYAGPIEATAIGNIVSQFIALVEVENLSEARQMIKKSFEIKTFKATEDVTK